jgi:glycine dehydrogenase
MIEPTESEALVELDRFCDAMIAIRREIAAVERGDMTAEASPLRHAPHTAQDLARDVWDRVYSRTTACFPAAGCEHKYWPPVNRIDNAFGDRNLVCACPPISVYSEAAE